VVELVILAPALVVLMLFVVYVGRAGGAVEQVRHAADEAARAASQVKRSSMAGVAQQIAELELASNGANCSSTSVAVSVAEAAAGQGGSVTVTVTCRLNISGTEPVLGRSRAITARSTEVIDVYRAG
jgi:Flp pilus assembly protein TadG